MCPSTIRKRTDPHLIHHGIPKVLVNPRSKGLQAFDLPLHTSYSNSNYDQTRKQLNYTREND
jgi:hypothetical protein